MTESDIISINQLVQVCTSNIDFINSKIGDQYQDFTTKDLVHN
jgi:hypothetical protein